MITLDPVVHIRRIVIRHPHPETRDGDPRWIHEPQLKENLRDGLSNLSTPLRTIPECRVDGSQRMYDLMLVTMIACVRGVGRVCEGLSARVSEGQVQRDTLDSSYNQ